MSRVVDLSLPMRVDDPRGTMRTVPYKTLAEHRANITLVTFDTHFGTHLDAPSHQLEAAPTLDLIDLDKCVGPAVVCDLSKPRASILIDRSDLEPFAESIRPSARILLRTDWSERFGTPEFTQGYPALTVAAAAWLAERGIALVGIDTPSIAPVYLGMPIVNAVHEPLLRAEIVIVEGLNRLSQLPAACTFAALPLNLIGLDGCPVRAIGIVPS